MNKQSLFPNEPDKILDQLTRSVRSPEGEFSSEESYKKFRERLPQQKKFKRYSLFRYAAATIILLMVSSSLIYFITQKEREMIMVATADEIKKVVLPDGTTVLLSRYSNLAYPSQFKQTGREITLEGEGYFEVTKNEHAPFTVTTQDIIVKVLGTRFNVRAYSQNSEIETTLLEGSVEVSRPNNEHTILLKPNEMAVFRKESGELLSLPHPTPANEITWTDDVLLFSNIPLSRIAEDLSNHFNIKIRITDEKLKTYRLTARFENRESLEEILNLLQSTANFDWKKEADSITIKPNQQ